MKNILVGITGGIAAYKSANIVSTLVKKGYSVKVVMTKSATEFITPLTLETLSKNPVDVDMWDDKKSYDVEHIALATWADLVVVVPATYNFVGKIANGIADDLLSTIIPATKAPVFFALAMNTVMYENPILKCNIDKLKSFGYNFIEADEGMLACGVVGKGRLKKEEDIIDIITKDFSTLRSDLLKNKKVLITAGRTEEALDPLRFLSNLSSGKMGYSLADAAINYGADVTLVSGPSSLNAPKGVNKFVKVRSALDMYDEVMKLYGDYDIIIGCAAVADYRPKVYSDQKIKKKDGDLTIELERNPDILKSIGEKKTTQFIIGFAAETQDVVENAKKKLKTKNLDAIIANNASAMQQDENSVFIITKDGKEILVPSKSKDKLAYDILNIIFNNKSN